jgi:hypothetical protein
LSPRPPLDSEFSEHKLGLLPIEEEEVSFDEYLKDPVVILMVHVIKQAIDDYREGRLLGGKKRLPCSRPGRQLKRDCLIKQNAREARRFLFGDGLKTYLKFAKLEDLINVEYIRNKIRSNTCRHFNFIRGNYE